MADLYDRGEQLYVDHCIRQTSRLPRLVRHAPAAALSSATGAPDQAEGRPLSGTAQPGLSGDPDA